ncbi:MAG: metallophosphoesterase, partial [Myxococcota bacterium]|nr:metallophosphoesterase [Myxococcota bacterium]
SGTCREPCGDYSEPFSVVLIPDTQYYTRKQPDVPENTYYQQMRWIVEHRAQEDIRFAIHLGDITDTNADSEWLIAKKAHAILDEAGMPYSVTPGNHDYRSDGEFDRGGSQFDTHFGPAKFAGQPWYGGHYGSSNHNNVTYFDVGPLKFMVLSLEYAPRKDVVCWAEQQILAHPEHRVILATHCYLSHGGAYAVNCPDEDYRVPGSNGRDLWEELVSRHSNVFLVVSGHVGDSEYVPRVNHTGTTVHQVLVDYQFEEPCGLADPARCTDHCHSDDRTYTGNGWLRQLTFYPRENRVESKTFTVETGNAAVFPGGVPALFCSEHNTAGHQDYPADPTAAAHAYSFAYDLGGTVSGRRDDAGLLGFADRTMNSAGAGDQLLPKVALSEGGDFVVVWEDDSSAADGAGMHDVFVRGFHAGGCPRFADRPVHATTAGQQTSPALAMDAAGNFVVAWADDGDANGGYQIHARGFDRDGAERIPRFTVNSESAGQQVTPAIAMSADGRFVIAWADDRNRDGRYQVRLRGFAANGAEAFGDRSAHDTDVGQRQRPALAMVAAGNFVVAWEDDTVGNGIYQIHARGFGPDGGARLPRFTVNSVAEGQQLVPAVAMAPDGRFVVSWEDDPERDGEAQLLVAGFTAGGEPRFADRTLPAQRRGTQRAASLGMAADGSCVAVWQDDQDGNGTYQIRTRGFDAAGAELFAERTVNDNAYGQQRSPGAAYDGGVLLTVWEDDMDGNGVYQIVGRGLDL